MTAVPTKPWLDVTLDLATNDPKDNRAKLYWVQFKCKGCLKTEMFRVKASKFDNWIQREVPEHPSSWPSMPEHIRSITSGFCTLCRKFGPKMHYLIVTGSRTFPNTNSAGELFFNKMVRYHWELMNKVPMTIVHGACRTGGADLWARNLEIKLRNKDSKDKIVTPIYFKEFPANWNRQPDGSYDAQAGFKRNAEMVNWVTETVKLSEFAEGPYHTAHAMAFIYRKSNGSSNCLDHIKTAGINYDLFARF